jgi:aminoglycoside phosphotransferase family enzyme
MRKTFDYVLSLRRSQQETLVAGIQEKGRLVDENVKCRIFFLNI